MPYDVRKADDEDIAVTDGVDDGRFRLQADRQTKGSYRSMRRGTSGTKEQETLSDRSGPGV
jgi:hypothetical protein